MGENSDDNLLYTYYFSAGSKDKCRDLQVSVIKCEYYAHRCSI